MKILIRIASEMVIKSGPVSKRFQKRLRTNLRASLKKEKIPFTLEGQWARLWLQTEDVRALEIIGRVFGVHSFSVIEHECAADRETIVREGTEFYKERIQGKTFAVQTRRIGKHDFTSMDLSCELGSALNVGNVPSMVRLHNPDVSINIEVRDERAYFYQNSIPGPGGLPIGTGGSCVSLVSGGFDSTVASWMMQKRGVNLRYLFCNLAGSANELSMLKVMLPFVQRWSYGDWPHLNVIDFQPVVAEILAKVSPAFSQVVLKRLFYLAAQKLVEQTDSLGILTGESLGQVSTQTLTNLNAISSAITTPIFRPLIASDKGDIIEVSRKIGLHDLCAQVKEYCQIVPEKPVTACSPERLEAEMKKIDLSILDKAFAERKVLTLLQMDDSDLMSSDIFKEEIPDDAIVIDCQSEEQFEHNHHPRATHWDFYDLLAKYKTFAKDQSYLIYCTFGTQSAVLAEKMQKDGYQAYSLRGGFKSSRT